MAQITLKTATGQDAGPLELDDAVFGIQPNVPVMHQVVTAQLAHRRAGTQSTKTRSEVRGGGAKPYRQKGTGNARQGSIRAPHYSGGGIALGPKPRSYGQRTPKKMIRLALRSALSDRAAEGKVLVVDGWGFDAPSTKAAKAALGALGVDGKVLVVVDRDDATSALSFRNLPEVQLIQPGELNAYDVLCNDWIVFTVTNVSALEAAGRADSALEAAGAASGRSGSSPLNDATDHVAPVVDDDLSALEAAGAASGRSGSSPQNDATDQVAPVVDAVEEPAAGSDAESDVVDEVEGAAVHAEDAVEGPRDESSETDEDQS